jgi:hypothetical protein
MSEASLAPTVGAVGMQEVEYFVVLSNRCHQWIASGQFPRRPVTALPVSQSADLEAEVRKNPKGICLTSLDNFRNWVICRTG